MWILIIGIIFWLIGILYSFEEDFENRFSCFFFAMIGTFFIAFYVQEDPREIKKEEARNQFRKENYYKPKILYDENQCTMDTVYILTE